MAPNTHTRSNFFLKTLDVKFSDLIIELEVVILYN